MLGGGCEGLLMVGRVVGSSKVLGCAKVVAWVSESIWCWVFAKRSP